MPRYALRVQENRTIYITFFDSIYYVVFRFLQLVNKNTREKLIKVIQGEED